MILTCHSKVVSKEGILLFSQRHISEFNLHVIPGKGDEILIDIKLIKDDIDLNEADLNNELLECEFLAMRYKQTEDLRKAVVALILSENRLSQENSHE